SGKKPQRIGWATEPRPHPLTWQCESARHPAGIAQKTYPRQGTGDASHHHQRNRRPRYQCAGPLPGAAARSRFLVLVLVTFVLVLLATCGTPTARGGAFFKFFRGRTGRPRGPGARHFFLVRRRRRWWRRRRGGLALRTRREDRGAGRALDLSAQQ